MRYSPYTPHTHTHTHTPVVKSWKDVGRPGDCVCVKVDVFLGDGVVLQQVLQTGLRLLDVQLELWNQVDVDFADKVNLFHQILSVVRLGQRPSHNVLERSADPDVYGVCIAVYMGAYRWRRYMYQCVCARTLIVNACV